VTAAALGAGFVTAALGLATAVGLVVAVGLAPDADPALGLAAGFGADCGTT
jgi:hypothetical protein